VVADRDERDHLGDEEQASNQQHHTESVPTVWLLVVPAPSPYGLDGADMHLDGKDLHCQNRKSSRLSRWA
jgi:hypothetical protein